MSNKSRKKVNVSKWALTGLIVDKLFSNSSPIAQQLILLINNFIMLSNMVHFIIKKRK